MFNLRGTLLLYYSNFDLLLLLPSVCREAFHKTLKSPAAAFRLETSETFQNRFGKHKEHLVKKRHILRFVLRNLSLTISNIRSHASPEPYVEPHSCPHSFAPSHRITGLTKRTDS